METKCLGWANYETWCVGDWLARQESKYQFWKTTAESCLKQAPHSRYVWDDSLSVIEAAECLLTDCLRETIEDSPVTQATIFADVLISTLDAVDWREIARNLLDDVQPKATDEQTRGSSGAEPPSGGTGSNTIVTGLVSALALLLEIVEAEYEEDPEPEDLPSWKRAIDAAKAAIAAAAQDDPCL